MIFLASNNLTHSMCSHKKNFSHIRVRLFAFYPQSSASFFLLFFYYYEIDSIFSFICFFLFSIHPEKEISAHSERERDLRKEIEEISFFFTGLTIKSALKYSILDVVYKRKFNFSFITRLWQFYYTNFI